MKKGLLSDLFPAARKAADKNEAAKKYFAKVLELNSNYPNTHYALGLIAEIEKGK